MKVKIFSHYFTIEELMPITVMEAESRIIRYTLKYCGGNIEMAANALGTTREELVVKLSNCS
ncbi:helix-turn-helix domain-containing protein [Candidatus Magnetobacterium casense]|uniref:DNA binding HTH domain-containing protein n=1 Tax=Candidatus Magnetobacterium casense TaxID=1455061 RepID=A0ABS6RYP2_9BACT|nr:helix-turn-helix domain-containing protein [Candidatus Magnetobacterium casensis]MBV6340908.1 hypothetical protein [Candidatus Magnetobacterium casensis]